MFSFLKKKRSDQPNQEIIKSSFLRVREDMNKVITWVSKTDSKNQNKISQIENKLESLDGKMEVILSLMNNKKQTKSQQISNQDYESEKEIENPTISGMDSLTDLQKTIVLRLYIILKEMDLKHVTMKFLAQELYPSKQYYSIRSMISTYTDNIEEQGLIKKERKGRETLISLTKKAHNQIKNLEKTHELVVK